MPAARPPTARSRSVGRPLLPPPTPHTLTQPQPVPPHSLTPQHLQELLRAQLRGTPWRHLLPLLLLGAAPRLPLLGPLGLRLAGPGLRPVGRLQVRLARAHGVGQRPAELLGRPEGAVGQGAAGGVVG
jgi:hypothetical protein